MNCQGLEIYPNRERRKQALNKEIRSLNKLLKAHSLIIEAHRILKFEIQDEIKKLQYIKEEM